MWYIDRPAFSVLFRVHIFHLKPCSHLFKRACTRPLGPSFWHSMLGSYLHIGVICQMLTYVSHSNQGGRLCAIQHSRCCCGRRRADRMRGFHHSDAGEFQGASRPAWCALNRSSSNILNGTARSGTRNVPCLQLNGNTLQKKLSSMIHQEASSTNIFLKFISFERSTRRIGMLHGFRN